MPMNMFNNGRAQYGPVAQGFMSKVFGWMGMGLFVSALTSYAVSPEVSPHLFATLFSGPIFAIMLVNVLIAIMFPFILGRISYVTAVALFVTYAALNGIMLSPLFAVYTGASIAYCFVAAALMFGIMALYGWVTNQDLSGLGFIAIMALLGLMIASIFNWWIQSESFNIFYSAAVVVIFALLTAYDVQKIKVMTRYQIASEDEQGKLALLGALILYLDLINIFLHLLRLFGEKKNRR
ncbi:Bax inhibitor-1/YccA family protein [bacterium]|nr:Bax inhibitor-1/YccA family protein [bacterium]NBX77997.1 Bax inhibitor-1/YccA family protein [bacterium]